MSSKKSDLILRRWGKRDRPVRKLILWGWDDRNNPSFLMLFGFHEFENIQVDITDSDIEEFNEEMILTGLSEYEYEISPGKYNILEYNVGYSGYILFRGNQGHFPNLKDLSLKISSSYDRYRRTRSYSRPYVVELKWTFSGGKYKPRRYGQLENCRPIWIPYFKHLSYEKLTDMIKSQGFTARNFKLANNPNELLNLENDSLRFLDLMIKLFSDEHLYMRKKYLNELLSLKPPANILKTIIEIGSPEVISGLLLELAKEKNASLQKPIKELLSKPINWTEQKYSNGLRRCANIYLNAIDQKLKENRIKEIREDIEELELIPVQIRKPRKPKWIKKKEPGMKVKDYISTWTATEWKYIGPSLKFKPNKFTNGTSLNHIFLKNILQEAYLYNLPDILGKIAHFIDTPKFLFLMLNSKWFGTGIYFERYIRRIMNEYTQFNIDNYFEVMKHFLSTYKTSDLVESYGRDIEYNKLLKYIIDLPRSTISGRGRQYSNLYNIPRIQSKDFKYNRYKNYYEMRNKLWSQNLEKVLDILGEITVDKIITFLFKFVKDAPNL
ncbi:MAG: hypothetical protein ACTSQJ_18015, partial [Promethearchaeota archaeon]